LVSELQSYILSTTTETCSYTLVMNSISGFNRTSFQQQLKQGKADLLEWRRRRFNRTSFQQQLKRRDCGQTFNRQKLQSYILSTTTETSPYPKGGGACAASIVHPFNNN